MRRLIFVLFFFLEACIDPLKLNTEGDYRRLVVDGFISDQPGPYVVKLFYSNPLITGQFLTPFEKATGAEVAIVDDLNNEFLLVELQEGVYSSKDSDLLGELGRSYKLKISTQDEKQYESSMQKLLSAGSIENISFEFVNNGLNNNGEVIHGLKVFTNARTVAEGGEFLRWRWTTTHKTISHPELHVNLTPGGEIPAPKGCSGYIVAGGGLIQVEECTCCICWSYNYSEGSYVSKNEFVSENLFNRQYIGMIPVTSMHFFDKYHIQIEQLSLSEEAYDFWSLIEKQQKGATDIFQPNAIKIRGNIISTTHPEEEVLGFFGVSAIVAESMFIDRGTVPVDLSSIPIIPFSCLDYFKNPTTEQPTYW